MSSKSAFELSTHTIAFLAILVLSFGAYMFSKWVLSGVAALVVVLSLAGTSALLVVLIIMNLAKVSSSNQILVFVAGMLALAFIVVAALDVVTRHTFPPRPILPSSAAQQPLHRAAWSASEVVITPTERLCPTAQAS